MFYGSVCSVSYITQGDSKMIVRFMRTMVAVWAMANGARSEQLSREDADALTEVWAEEECGYAGVNAERLAWELGVEAQMR